MWLFQPSAPFGILNRATHFLLLGYHPVQHRGSSPIGLQKQGLKKNTLFLGLLECLNPFFSLQISPFMELNSLEKKKTKNYVSNFTQSRQEWDGVWKKNVKSLESFSWCSKKWKLTFLAGSEIGGICVPSSSVTQACEGLSSSGSGS